MGDWRTQSPESADGALCGLAGLFGELGLFGEFGLAGVFGVRGDWAD